MLKPPHLGELIRESMQEAGWTVGETAGRLGCERGTLSRVLNGKAGVSANMALALESIDWGTTDHAMRMQAAYELAQAPARRRSGAGARERSTTTACRHHQPTVTRAPSPLADTAGKTAMRTDPECSYRVSIIFSSAMNPTIPPMPKPMAPVSPRTGSPS